MGNRLVHGLGAAARAARRAGLGGMAARARDGVDAAFVAAERPPLRSSYGGLQLRGFLRHRSALADAARGSPGSYRVLFERTLRPGMTVVDGGAHLGLFALLASRVVGSSGVVLAFEPDPYNLPALRWNLRGHANVCVVPKALADRPGVASFRQSSSTIGSALGPGGRVEAELTTLDAELARLELDALLVKLNIEGAEPLALEGMRESLSRAREVVLFAELNPEALREAGREPEALPAELRKLGLKVWRIDLVAQAPRPLTSLEKGHLLARRAR